MNEENRIIAASLLEWTQNSKNEWLDAEAADLAELRKLAESKGIIIPSPDLSILKTYYAEIGVANRNGVILEKADVEKSLPSLIGKQVNFDHSGAGQVCGYILDAKLEGKMIVAYACIFKSLFKDKFDEVKSKFAEGDLTVSFEIYNVDPETKQSVVKYLEDGTRIISPILFHGCGLLLTKPPACPKAKVMALLAEYIDEKILEEANKVIEPILTKNEELVYAQLALPCQQCANCIKGEKDMEEAKTVNEPIDPNLFLKADGILDEEKIEAALPPEVTARVKALIKEGKSPSEAVKQSWEEYKKGKEKAEEVKTEEIVQSEVKVEEVPVAEVKVEAKAEEIKTEETITVTTSTEETATTETVVTEVKPVEDAHTQREGNQNWSCPDCAFTFPLLSSDSPMPQYCPRCGMAYYSETDESPCSVTMQDGCELPNEEMIHDDESTDLEESKKLPYGKRQELPDSDFAVVVKSGDKKIRMYPIQDEAHVRNALARLGQAKPRATLKSLGVSLESVKRKILSRARKLGMTDLLERYKETSSVEEEAIQTLANLVEAKKTEYDTLKAELDAVKAELEKATKDKEAEIQVVKAELEQKTQEMASLKKEIESTNPVLSVGSVDDKDELKKAQAECNFKAFGVRKVS